MKKSFLTKYIFLLLSLTLLSSVQVDAQSVLGVKGEYSSSFGFYIKDLKTGKVLFESNADKALVPASITKSFTSATALSLLGADFRFKTKVTLENYKLSKGNLNGRLVVHAAADPTLESEFFMENRGFCDSIASRLSKLGVKNFNGEIVVADTLPDQGQIDSWTIDDTPWAYGAGFYGLNYKDNTSYLWPATGKTKPVIPGLNVVLHRARSTNLSRGIGSSTIHVYAPRKTLADKNWKVVTTMPDPAASFVEELKEALKEEGISFTPTAISSGKNKSAKTLYIHCSPALEDILHSLMVRSDNMFAEGVLRALTPGKSRSDALDAELSLWQSRGFDTDNVTIMDGSGLSRADRISPVFMAKMLEWMAKSKMAEKYISLFPVSGVDGTMKNFCKDNRLSGRLAFKTGSMSGVQCYAGYVLAADSGSPTHVVIIMANSFFCSRSQLKTAIENFLLEKLPE